MLNRMAIGSSDTQVIFYYPSKKIGGAQILFSRISSELARVSSYNVMVIDYLDGYISKNSEGVDLIEHTAGKLYDIDKKSIIVCPLSNINNIDRIINLKAGGGYLFWGIHPENTILILKYAYTLKKYIKKSNYLIKLLNYNQCREIKKKLTENLQERKVFFMDDAVKESTLDFYSIEKDYDEYLPIPIKEYSLGGDSYCKRDLYTFAWIGRLDSDKIYSLLYVIEQLNLLDFPEGKIIIIGDGDSKYKINPDKYKNINILFTGTIENNLLKSELYKRKVGLVFGMGTSVLESAIYKIPSVIVDPSHKRISKRYVPKWLFETENYCLGSFNLKENNRRNSFKALLDEYVKNDEYIANECYEYAKSKHSIKKVIGSIANYIKNIDSNT